MLLSSADAKRYGDAPEEGNEGEEKNRHAGARVVKDAFVPERASCRVAVEKREKRKETDLTEMRVL